jgi:hypothetical protein
MEQSTPHVQSMSLGQDEPRAELEPEKVKRRKFYF